MGITRFWIWGTKSRSVRIFSQQSDFGFGTYFDQFSSQLRAESGGAEFQVD